PVVIRGELLKSIEKLIPYLEFMNRGNLRLVQESDLSKLKSKAFLKSNAQYTREIIKKQSFKFVLLGIAMYAYLQKDQVVDYIFDADPWSTLLEGSSFEKLSSVEQNHVGHLLKDNVNLELTEKIANFHKNKKSSSKSYNNVSEVLNKTNSLKKVEKKSGAAAVVYIFRNGRVVSGNPQKILNLIDSSTDDQILLAFHYPASRRILLVTNTMTQEKTEESFLTVAIDGEQDREMYIAIKNKLKDFETNE
ncbi:MAG: hypothetical protein J7501_17760, partial [Bdellovibrio sp.]|nr:hypothetical protein [Bdellovibrio sp.]